MEIAVITPFSRNLQMQELPLFDNEKEYPLKPFDEKIILFFDSFSKRIFATKELNKIPEIAALGFWLRKANVQKMQQENVQLLTSPLYKVSPRGIVFHICPANVDTMFIYSMAVSALMGNKNLLRISTRMNAPQIAALFDLLNKTMEQFPELAAYINIVTYDHNEEINQFFSEKAAVRVIWGGDQTIERFKKIKSAPRTKDIVFPDRISILCIGSGVFNSLSTADENKFATFFYNDAYTFDQKGCSSPQAIFIIGDSEDNRRCVKKLEQLLSSFIEQKYKTDIASIAALKLNYIVDEAMESNAFKVEGTNFATFIIREKQSSVLKHTCGGGLFNVYLIKDVLELKEFIVPKLQTISYFGMTATDLKKMQELSNGEGIDRIVPIGSALDFYYLWDGYNLFDELSKKVFIKLEF